MVDIRIPSEHEKLEKHQQLKEGMEMMWRENVSVALMTIGYDSRV